MQFEIYRQPDKEQKHGWCWRLCGAAEGVVAFGEGYPSRSDCLRAVELVRGTSGLTPIVEDV